MKLKVPRADAVAFGSLISALIVVVGELHWEHPVKVAAQALLGFIGAVVVNPIANETPAPAPSAIAPVPGATTRPDVPPATDGDGQPL